MARNVADAVKPPRDPRKEMTTWTPEAVKRFLDVAKTSSYGPIWVLSLITGMREGELLGISWRHVDFAAGTGTIQQTAGVVRGKTFIKPMPKTSKSRRAIVVPPSVMAMLRDHRAKQLERKMMTGPEWHNEHDLVFTSERGTIVGPRNLDRQCDRLIAKAGVPCITVHGQRHTHATALRLAGVDPKVISERLGHSSMDITLEVYSHLTPEKRREAADAVERLLFA